MIRLSKIKSITNRLMAHSSQLIALILLPLLFSCGKNNSSDENLKIFKYNESAGILTLDPIYAKDLPHIWACNQIFNGLVAFDDEMNVVPAIAKSWNISDDGMTYTFILRDDVWFHEDTCFAVKTPRHQDTKTQRDEYSATQQLSNSATRKVVAQDFVYSFNRVLDRKLNSSGSWIFANVANSQQLIANSLSSTALVQQPTYAFNAINDTVLEIKLTQAFPAFLGILSMSYASVVPHEAVEYYGTEFGRHPVGTGPFKYQYWKEGVKLVFRKNPNYFEVEETTRLQDYKTTSDFDSVTQQLSNSATQRLPYLDAISISFIIDKQVAFMEFIKGKFHFMSGIDARYKDELLTRDGQLRSEYEDEIYLIREPYLNTEYLAFFLGDDDTLGKDRSLALRQAVSYSIDKEKMLRYLRNGIGTPGNNGIIPAGLPGYEDYKTTRLQDHKLDEANIGYPYNPKKAELLLKDNNLIGYEMKLYTTQDYIDIAKFVQSALTEIGLNCRVEEMMPAALREKRANGNLPFFRSSWVADYPDAENYLSLFTTNNFTPQGPNYTHYSNAKFDELYQKSLTCNDLEERAKIYHEMDSLMMTEAPVVILFYDEVLRFVNKNVEGLGSNPTNMLNLKRVRIN
ncbi:MAG: ABC transporter substrate-binding protein [Bacteroidales bacterium]|nr:ABC transporter substrate-binding protein [Bacteroidales bacterium]